MLLKKCWLNMAMLTLCTLAIGSGCAKQESTNDKPKKYTEDEVRELLVPKDFTNGRQILKRAGVSVFPEYEQILSDPEVSPRKKALIYLVLDDLDCDRTQFYPYCIEHLQDVTEYFTLRSYALDLLGDIGTVNDVQILCAVLDDEWTAMSYGAATILAKLGDQNALDALNIWIQVRGREQYHEESEHFIKCRDELKARLAKKNSQS